MSPLSSAKARLRDAIPLRHQVPAKYLFNAMAGRIEAEMDLLRKIVRRGDLAVDVGGNRGIYAYRLWRLGARLEVFEPNPSCASVIEAWARSKNDIHVHSVALSATSGSASLRIPVDSDGVEHDASASLEAHPFAGAREEQVALRTLDSYEFDQVSFLKIDVEGHESKVLGGARNTIQTARPALLIEIEQRHIDQPMSDVIGQICEMGYRGYFLASGHLIGIEDFKPERDQNPSNLSRRNATYINNFLFLERRRLQHGEYPSLPIAVRA